MINPVSYEINKQNLFQICDILERSNIEYTVFYGTMLGIHRDGKIIESDDDVDVLVKVSDFMKVLFAIKSSGLVISKNVDKMFLQVRNTINDIKSYVDIYFYYDSGYNYIIEPWNFLGRYMDKENHLHIPYNLVFPVKTFNYDGKLIKIPSESEQLCQFLYGENYRLPMRKKIDYTTKIVNNKPEIIYHQTL